MGGYSPPPDRSVELAQFQAQQAREARAEERRLADEKRARFDRDLDNAFTLGTSQARRYFEEQGLDPDDYTSDIAEYVDNVRRGVPLNDANPMTYFADIGKRIWDQEQTQFRNRSLRSLRPFTQEGFATNRFGDTLDDQYLQSILAENRVKADEYIQRLLDRGVITDVGAAAAKADVDKQQARANIRLQDIGASQLEGLRGGLRDIAAQARTAASGLHLGDTFDSEYWRKRIDDKTAEGVNLFSDKLRAATPDDLFDTSRLALIAGIAQGSRNKSTPNKKRRQIFGAVDDEKEDNDANEFAPF